jgi:hypothetical protein
MFGSFLFVSLLCVCIVDILVPVTSLHVLHHEHLIALLALALIGRWPRRSLPYQLEAAEGATTS